MSYDARWSFEPGPGIEPGSAAAVNGAAARFTFEVPRWGKRGVGTVTLSLHDRWRLAEGRVTLTLPSIDCYPSPAVQRTEVVLARLPNRLGEHRARAPGDGTEFNGVREFVPGDRQRAINWPASTRLWPPAGEHVRRRAVAGRGAARGRDLGRRRAGRVRARPGAPRRGGRGPRLPGRP